MGKTAADQFRPVTRLEPCVICGHGDWCRRSASGAAECHRSAEERVNGYARIATTPNGFGVYRLPKAPPPPHPVGGTKRNGKPPRVYPTPDAAAEGYAKYMGGAVGASWEWTREWHRFRLQLADGKSFVEVTKFSDGWICKGPPKPYQLFRIHELPADGTIYVVEGEKCADAMRSIDLFATTSGSASSADSADWAGLAKRDVVIICDSDAAGREYAVDAAIILAKLGCTLRTVDLYPDRDDGSDIADWIEERDSRDSSDICGELAALVAKASQTKPEFDRLLVRTASDYTPKAVEWLWYARIPLGKLTVIAGDPKVGKSFFTVYLAAVVSAAQRWAGPGMADCALGDVIMLSAEDDPEDTIIPRLIAAGANMDRVHIVEGVREAGDKDSGQFRLDTHLRLLERVLDARPNVRLVTIDPISAFMGETDSNNNAEVRALLAPLAKLAAARGIAVVAVSHLNKSAGVGTKAIYRTQASLAFVAAARSVWYVLFDSENKERRLFLPAGMNLAECPGGLAYTIRPAVNGGPCVVWEDGRIDLDADDGIAAEESRKPASGTAKAEAWLRTRLAEGPMLVKDLDAEARAHGFTPQQVRGARERLGVQVTQVREGSKLTGWRVSMPEVSV